MAYRPIADDDYDRLEEEGVELSPSILPLSPVIPIVHATMKPSLSINTTINEGEWASSTCNSLAQIASRDDPTVVHPKPGSRSSKAATPQDDVSLDVQRLEETAEKLAVASNLEFELKKMRDEQKKSDSRRSSYQAARQYSGHSGSPAKEFRDRSSLRKSIGFTTEDYVQSPVESVRSSITPNTEAVSEEVRLKMEENTKVQSLWNLQMADEDEPTTQDLKVVNGDVEEKNENNSLAHHLDERNAFDDSAYQGHHGHHDDDPDLAFPEDGSPPDTNLADPFTDFDGAHNILHPLAMQEPVQDPMESGSTTQYSMPQRNGLVYYPAPIPKMITLPPRLSKRPPQAYQSQRESQIMKIPRQSAMLPSVTLKDRESQSEEAASHGHSLQSKPLPPQLRASMFFDQQSALPEIEAKDGSASKTLDSILDASVTAPVHLFVDHPIVGELGKEVYGQTLADRRKSRALGQHNARKSMVPPPPEHKSSGGLLQNLKNRASIFNFGKKQTSGEESMGLGLDDEDYDEDVISPEEMGAQSNVEFNAQPTTLMMELHLRKQEQASRNRTAATAFPNGMRSTLMELDAVAEVQKKARQQRPVTLAWENSQDQINKAATHDNDDVPLGMLFPGPKAPVDKRREGDRQAALVAKRIAEDNEPLAQRRARLLGEEYIPKPKPDPRDEAFKLPPPRLGDTDLAEPSDDDDEPLSQRRDRLKAKKAAQQGRRHSTDFTNEVLSQFGGLEEQPEIPLSVTPPNETLGQRKKRLAALEAAGVKPNWKNKLGAAFGNQQQPSTVISHPYHVMPNAGNYIGYDAPAQNYGLPVNHAVAPQARDYYGGNPTALSGGYASAGNNIHPIAYNNGYAQAMSNGHPVPMTDGYAAAMHHQPVRPHVYRGPTSYGHQGQHEAPLDPKQRQVIDKWLQNSVRG